MAVAEMAPPGGHLVPSALLGLWNVRRRILDRKDGAVSRFEGQARLSVTAFEEVGTLTIGLTGFPSGRSYSLQSLRDGILVRRISGSPFVTLSLAARQRLLHHCGDDIYSGQLRFSGSGWIEVWSVTGPRKNYLSIGRYRRL